MSAAPTLRSGGTKAELGCFVEGYALIRLPYECQAGFNDALGMVQRRLHRHYGLAAPRLGEVFLWWAMPATPPGVRVFCGGPCPLQLLYGSRTDLAVYPIVPEVVGGIVIGTGREGAPCAVNCPSEATTEALPVIAPLARLQHGAWLCYTGADVQNRARCLVWPRKVVGREPRVGANQRLKRTRPGARHEPSSLPTGCVPSTSAIYLPWG